MHPGATLLAIRRARRRTWLVTRDFLAREAAGGILLMSAAALALIVANSPLAPAYLAALHYETGPMLAPALGPMSVHLWINDALMALFFLLVGLEIKREVVDGRLSSRERRRLPLIAAAAGMLAPMAVYLAVAGGEPALHRGWAIPAATDIAFAIGVLALLGDRVPASLKLLLTAIAVIDDIGAVAIIAIGYTDALDLVALAEAGLVAAVMVGMNRLGVRRLSPYLLAFALLWLATLRSGVHATVAGVIAALLIPATPSPGAPDDARSPLHRLEHGLHPWVAYAIVPLFGFANAGVGLGGASLATVTQPLVLAIALGLFLGKQLGVFGGIVVAVRLGIARRPRGVSWVQLYGMALIAGIGFTMSLFIGGLAFRDPAVQDAVKIGVLAGSLLSALAGYAVLRLAAPKR